jgi:hypothetical protein
MTIMYFIMLKLIMVLNCVPDVVLSSLPTCSRHKKKKTRAINVRL